MRSVQGRATGRGEPWRIRDRRSGGLAALGLLLVLAACGRGADRRPVSPPEADRQASAPAPSTATADSRPRIVILGDSLTAGHGLPSVDEAYPAVLQQKIDRAGYDFEVINAGVSGDTTAGGLSRLNWSLQGDVRILVVALGGNDGLRGVPAAEMERNLSAIIETAQSRGIAVLLAGMEAPPNYGPVYTAQFREVFRHLASRDHVAFLPFLLQGVAGVAALNQPDGIHPTAAGAQIVAGNVWRVLQPMLAAAKTR
ncbi:MAG: arylesterase [Acidobacteriota bacterium]|nr:arylesterase [Acidobacteriota bacterium]